MVRIAILGCLMFLTLPAHATDVGILGKSRMNGDANNIQNGELMSSFRKIWEGYGAQWKQTTDITDAFLGTVSVFVTGNISTQRFTAQEQDAVTKWVRGGGTLVVIGECGCTGNEYAYNDLLRHFGVHLDGDTPYGDGHVLTAHPLTSNLFTVYFGKNGHLTGPDSNIPLLTDPAENLAALVLEGTPEVGKGRLFVVADTDMFNTVVLERHPENQFFARNIAKWAMHAKNVVSGRVLLDECEGLPANIEITIHLVGDGIIEAATTTLDGEGRYRVEFEHDGAFDVVAHVDGWLSKRRAALTVLGKVTVDWEFDTAGDFDNDDAIDAGDLVAAITTFEPRTGARTVALVMANFGLNDRHLDLDGDGEINIYRG